MSAGQSKDPAMLVVKRQSEKEDTAAWDEPRLERRRTWRFMISRESERESRERRG